MNEELFIVSLIGGISVILSYIYLYYDNDSEKAWGGLEEGNWRMAWIVSTGLTTISYIFLWVCFVFIIEEKSTILFTGWLLFLSSASQWAYLTLIDIKEARKSVALLINLTVTTIACVMILIVSLTLEGHDSLKPYLLVSSVYLVIHHGIADNWLWYAAFPDLNFIPM